MSTGSAASDAEEEEGHQRRSRLKRKTTCYSPDRFSEEEDDRRRKQAHSSSSRLSEPHQKEAQQTQRNAANARERARMRVLSKAFSRLKTSLPWVPADTKLSKLDTLRLASSYISHLRQLLQEERFETSFAHPVSLVGNFLQWLVSAWFILKKSGCVEKPVACYVFILIFLQTWPFLSTGRAEEDMSASVRLCGATA